MRMLQKYLLKLSHSLMHLHKKLKETVLKTFHIQIQSMVAYPRTKVIFSNIKMVLDLFLENQVQAHLAQPLECILRNTAQIMKQM